MIFRTWKLHASSPQCITRPLLISCPFSIPPLSHTLYSFVPWIFIYFLPGFNQSCQILRHFLVVTGLLFLPPPPPGRYFHMCGTVLKVIHLALMTVGVKDIPELPVSATQEEFVTIGWVGSWLLFPLVFFLFFWLVFPPGLMLTWSYLSPPYCLVWSVLMRNTRKSSRAQLLHRSISTLFFHVLLSGRLYNVIYLEFPLDFTLLSSIG